MTLTPVFPTKLHENAAGIVKEFFQNIPNVDTVLVVNSCARGQAVPESDLDFAILVNPEVTPANITNIETAWQAYAQTQPVLLKYKGLGPSAHLHLDVITGQYSPGIMEVGGGPDYFEIEIGNQICYSAPMAEPGPHFKTLRNKWLPYYSEDLQRQRFTMTGKACEYDLDHIPIYVNRGLYFHAFDRLYTAFQKFLQALFIAKRTYPIAYNKWIRLQVETWLDMPDLYARLSPIISVANIESAELNDKARMLRELLNTLPG
jgi:predicted nucleotidyltransferase